MYIEKNQNKISNISTFQVFRDVLIKPKKPQKNHKKPKNQNLF